MTLLMIFLESYINYTLNHLKERIKVYNEEQLIMNIPVNIKKWTINSSANKINTGEEIVGLVEVHEQVGQYRTH